MRRIIYIIILILFSIFLSQYRQSFVPLFENILSERRGVLQFYKTELVKTRGGYQVRLRDIVGTSSSEKSSVYIRMDLVIDTENKKLAEEMKNKSDYTVATIREAMDNVSPEMLSTTSGKEALKQNIEKKINDKFGDGAVGNIYFENFVYE